MARLALAAALSGCSLAFVTPPPAQRPPTAGNCTSNRLPVLADGTWTLASLVATGFWIFVARLNASDNVSSREPLVAAGLSGAIAVGFAASTYRGARLTGECEELRAEEARSRRPRAPILE